MTTKTKTRITVYKDSKNQIVYKLEVYEENKSSKSKRIITERSGQLPTTTL